MQIGGATHDVRYQWGGHKQPSYEYNNPANNHKAGGYTPQAYQVGGKWTFAGMKMPRKKFQAGGQEDILVANDQASKRIGLNDQNYQRAVLNLKGTNMIRGLDNGRPVSVTDGNKHKVLHGPHDTDYFTGKVFEKAL